MGNTAGAAGQMSARCQINTSSTVDCEEKSAFFMILWAQSAHRMTTFYFHGLIITADV